MVIRPGYHNTEKPDKTGGSTFAPPTHDHEQTDEPPTCASSHLLAPPNPYFQTFAATRALLLKQVAHQPGPPPLPLFLVLPADFLQQRLQALDHLHDDKQRCVTKRGLLVCQRARVERDAGFLGIGPLGVGLAALGFWGVRSCRRLFALPAQFAERDRDAAVAD
jgi:hypothetical protein